jgi:hypothetical protein
MMERLFPIQDGPDIPWRVMARHEAAALKQHDQQPLEKLAERRGLSVDEAISVIAGAGDYGRYWGTPGRDRHDLKGNTQTLMNLVYAELLRG